MIDPPSSANVCGVSVVETVLVYAVIPLGALVLFALMVYAPRRGSRPRYRSGETWEHPPVWWSGNPAGTGLHAGQRAVDDTTAGSSFVGGGARGTW